MLLILFSVFSFIAISALAAEQVFPTESLKPDLRLIMLPGQRFSGRLQYYESKTKTSNGKDGSKKVISATKKQPGTPNKFWLIGPNNTSQPRPINTKASTISFGTSVKGQWNTSNSTFTRASAEATTSPISIVGITRRTPAASRPGLPRMRTTMKENKSEKANKGNNAAWIASIVFGILLVALVAGIVAFLYWSRRKAKVLGRKAQEKSEKRRITAAMMYKKFSVKECPKRVPLGQDESEITLGTEVYSGTEINISELHNSNQPSINSKMKKKHAPIPTAALSAEANPPVGILKPSSLQKRQIDGSTKTSSVTKLPGDISKENPPSTEAKGVSTPERSAIPAEGSSSSFLKRSLVATSKRPVRKRNKALSSTSNSQSNKE